MSAEIIEILDYLCSKIGITIDWTAENVWPQVMDFIGRYQLYSIIKCGIWIVFGVIIIISGLMYSKHIWKDISLKRPDSIWYDAYDSEFSHFVTIVLWVLAFAFVIVIMSNIFSIATWATVPEVKFFEMLSRHMD